MVTDYWDVSFVDGFQRPIRGFSFHIYKGSHPTICYKPTRYVHHEYEVMRKLVGRMDENGVAEKDDGMWGSLVVIAAKPHQEKVLWHKY